MSVPSSNVATTCDRPNFEIERTPSRPLRPPSASSTSEVICRSTSSGASSGATVLTCTWTGVVSGKASSGKWAAARTPTTISKAPTSRTTNRFLRLASISALSIAGLPPAGWSLAAPGADGALHDLGLEQEGPPGDDRLAGLEAPGDLDDVAAVGRLGDDAPGAIGPRLVEREEDQVGTVLALDGLLGDDGGAVLGADLDLGHAELVGPQAAAGVGQLGPDAGGAGLVADLGADPGDLAQRDEPGAGRVGPRDRERDRLAG